MVALEVIQRVRDFCRDALCAETIVFVKGCVAAIDIHPEIVAHDASLKKTRHIATMCDQASVTSCSAVSK